MLLPDRLGSGASTRLLLPALAFANFAIGIGAFVVVGILSPIAAGLRLGHSQAGLVMSVYALSYAVCSPLAIAATGRLERRTVVMIGMAVFLAATVLCALAPSPSVLFAGRALAALGAGMVTPVAAAIAVSVSPPERRGAALATVFLGLTLAQVAGIPLGSYIGYSAGWRATFWMVAGISLVAFGCLARIVPADIRTPVTTLASLARALTTPILLVAILITASITSAAYILFTYFAPLLEERMQYGRDGVTLILVLYGGGAVLGNAIGGRLADRIGPGRTLVLFCLAQIAVTPLFSLLPFPSLAVAALAILWGTVGWSFMAPQQSRLIALAPAMQNVMLALNASAIYIGAAIGAAIGGIIVERAGFGALGLASGIGAAAVLGHVLLSRAQERGAAAAAN